MKRMIDERFKELSKYQIWFGKHKGKTFDEIPLSYLDWLVEQKSGSEAFQFAVKVAKEYLSYDIIQNEEQVEEVENG